MSLTDARPDGLNEAAEQLMAASTQLGTTVTSLRQAHSAVGPRGWWSGGAIAYLDCSTEIEQAASDASEVLKLVGGAARRLATQITANQGIMSQALEVGNRVTLAVAADPFNASTHLAELQDAVRVAGIAEAAHERAVQDARVVFETAAGAAGSAGAIVLPKSIGNPPTGQLLERLVRAGDAAVSALEDPASLLPGVGGVFGTARVLIDLIRPGLGTSITAVINKHNPLHRLVTAMRDRVVRVVEPRLKRMRKGAFKLGRRIDKINARRLYNAHLSKRFRGRLAGRIRHGVRFIDTHVADLIKALPARLQPRAKRAWKAFGKRVGAGRSVAKEAARFSVGDLRIVVRRGTRGAGLITGAKAFGRVGSRAIPVVGDVALALAFPDETAKDPQELGVVVIREESGRLMVVRYIGKVTLRKADELARLRQQGISVQYDDLGRAFLIAEQTDGVLMRLSDAGRKFDPKTSRINANIDFSALNERESEALVRPDTLDRIEQLTGATVTYHPVVSTTEDLVDANADFFDQQDYESGNTTSRAERINQLGLARLRPGGDGNIAVLPYGLKPRITIWATTSARRNRADQMLREAIRETRKSAA